jgi:phosphoglycerate dehydrogenase-like enzyme
VLEPGPIGGGTLDLYAREPLPPDHRLRTLPNLPADSAHRLRHA